MRPDVLALAALLLVGVAAASAAGPARSLAQTVAPAVVHGKDSPRVGWYVSIGFMGDGKWVSYCGGMLITQTTVLTAAHCVVNGYGLPMFPKNVAIGIRNPATDKAGVDYDLATVINTVVHPRLVRPFTEETGYDIALLQLDPETVSGKNELVALPTYVPKPRNPVPAGTRLQLIGLGDLGNDTAATVLQRTELVLEPLDTCNEAWLSQYNANFFQSTFICAGAPRDNKFTDACPGDSGGPLYAPKTAGRPYDTAIGLVSYGEDCDVLFNRTKYGRPGVYTNIAQLRKWIDGNLACLAKGLLCPWANTCLDNPANGCATCDDWNCEDCTVPGYKVDRKGQCRPVDCRNDDENCVECARRRPLTCAACDWGYKVANGKCVLKTCLDYDRGCQQCDPASPLSCAACKRGHALVPATGKCVHVRG